MDVESWKRVSLSRPGTFGLPLVGRFGLAHSLLAWARCELWCKDHAVPMLSPNWNHLRVGPYLRREKDKREYQRLFTFPHYVTGVLRAWLLWKLPHVSAIDLRPDRPIDTTKRQIIVFENRVTENFEYHFHEVVGRAPELRSALSRMTKPRHLPSKIDEPHIAVHVRLGDFSVSVTEQDLRGGHRNSRLPTQWYVKSLLALRAALGRDVSTIVYSDGEDEDLADLLSIPAVRRAPEQSAVTNLLSISQASVLISSGSGFSTWGCFLGGVPRLCFPGQRQIRALGEPDSVDREPEVDFNQPIPPAFVEYVKRRLTHSSF